MGKAAVLWKPEERRLIRAFSNGAFLEYARSGDVPNFQIYYVDFKGQRRRASREEALSRLVSFSESHDRLDLYHRYSRLYELSSHDIESEVLKQIDLWAKDYAMGDLSFQCLYSFLYAELVLMSGEISGLSERRLQRLAIHHVLIEERPVSYACRFSTKVSRDRVIAECVLRGF
jgi:hypothetical protein